MVLTGQYFLRTCGMKKQPASHCKSHPHHHCLAVPSECSAYFGVTWDVRETSVEPRIVGSAWIHWSVCGVELIGTIGLVAEHLFIGKLTGSAVASENKKKVNGKPIGRKVTFEQNPANRSTNLASFCRNVALTGGVLLGMAVWSFVGAQPRIEGSSPMPGVLER